jgi:hypothetical protein
MLAAVFAKGLPGNLGLPPDVLPGGDGDID